MNIYSYRNQPSMKCGLEPMIFQWFITTVINESKSKCDSILDNNYDNNYDNNCDNNDITITNDNDGNNADDNGK